MEPGATLTSGRSIAISTKSSGPAIGVEVELRAFGFAVQDAVAIAASMVVDAEQPTVITDGGASFSPPVSDSRPAGVALLAEVLPRLGTIPLIDFLKEAVLRSGCLTEISAVAGSGLAADVFAERLLLAVYAYGTNIGIRSVAAGVRSGSDHPPPRVRSAPQNQTDQRCPPLPSKVGRAGCISSAATSTDPPDPLGRHRAEL